MKSVELREHKIVMRTGAQAPEGMSVPPRKSVRGGCTLVVLAAL